MDFANLDQIWGLHFFQILDVLFGDGRLVDFTGECRTLSGSIRCQGCRGS